MYVEAGARGASEREKNYGERFSARACAHNAIVFCGARGEWRSALRRYSLKADREKIIGKSLLLASWFVSARGRETNLSRRALKSDSYDYYEACTYV